MPLHQVVFVMVNTNAAVDSVTVNVGNSTDPGSKGFQCTRGPLGTGTTGVWCNGTEDGLYGVVGQYVWISSDAVLSLCEVDVYARSTWGLLTGRLLTGQLTVS